MKLRLDRKSRMINSECQLIWLDDPRYNAKAELDKVRVSYILQLRDNTTAKV